MVRKIAAIVVALALSPFAASAQARPDSLEFVRVKRPTFNVVGDMGLGSYDQSLNARTEPGFAFGAHLDINPTRIITVELGYLGALNDLNPRFSKDGRLVTNQVGGDLRINFVPPNYDLPGRLTPYVFGGAAYQHITTQNFTPGMSDASTLAVPLGVGVEVDAANRVFVGARFTYNLLFFEQDNFSGGDTDSWAATVNVGARLTQ